MKYDHNGTRQWAKIYDAPGSGDNTIYSIALDKINNALYVTGYSVISSVGSAATIKYNIFTGDSLWVRRGFGVSGSNSAWDVHVDSQGNAYITGSCLGISSSDVATLKYTSLGTTQWLITYNGTFNGTDGGRSLKINGNNIYVLGYSKNSSLISDYVLIKYNRLTRIQPVSNEIPTEFILKQNFPNPFNPTTKIKFSISNTSFVQLRIYDVLGRIKETPVNEKLHPSEYELAFDGVSYSSGVYFYQLIADNKIIDTKKFIIIK